ncbi:uncharacterized protein LOC118186337 [Stegodyphus dumicola]|uniref:uncharacterized protein LOC118186337 n=1 Tax=Stegodyphus dumicola TaxID=202533 RepID=UPI0015AA6B74|nr:uncharacterized protein LOC118186337 [Stegodyphus dumicola]
MPLDSESASTSKLEAKNIWDIIRDDTPNKYSAAKERLLSTFKESENKRIKRLLTGLELGDLKPSQLLRKMRALGDADDVSEKILRTLWMEKLPDQVKNILIVSDEGTDKLATMADKILEMNPRIELASVVQEAGPYDMLLKKISSLEQQIATLSVQHTRDRRRSQSHQRNRSRSRSRKRFDPDGKYCFFHFKFGKKCYPDKCKPPCSWKQPENCN